jgi:hypothetical protein
MGWFRSHKRPSAWLALLALVFQLGLAFGHVHPIHAGKTAVAASVAAASHQGSGDSDDDYCATCAVLALLAGAQTASAPVLAPPLAVSSDEITLAPETPRIVSPRAAFRSRAPPLS